MRLVKLSLAASILVQTGMAAAAVEMTRPFEALEQSRRAMNELDKRQKREEVERARREKEQEVKRKSEEAGQRKRDAQEKAGQEAQRKRDAVAAKAAKDARSPSTSPSPQPTAAPAVSNEPSAQAPPKATSQAAEQQNAPPAGPQTPPAAEQVGVPHGSGNPSAAGVTAVAPKSAVAAAPAAGAHAVAVSRLKRMNLYNERGDKLGDVERVLQSPDGNFHIVVGTGGFLGIREHDIRIPLDRVTMRADRLLTQGLTDDQVRTMPVFDRKDRTYRDLARNTTVRIVGDPSPN